MIIDLISPIWIILCWWFVIPHIFFKSKVNRSKTQVEKNNIQHDFMILSWKCFCLNILFCIQRGKNCAFYVYKKLFMNLFLIVLFVCFTYCSSFFFCHLLSSWSFQSEPDRFTVWYTFIYFLDVQFLSASV